MCTDEPVLGRIRVPPCRGAQAEYRRTPSCLESVHDMTTSSRSRVTFKSAVQRALQTRAAPQFQHRSGTVVA